MPTVSSIKTKSRWKNSSIYNNYKYFLFHEYNRNEQYKKLKSGECKYFYAIVLFKEKVKAIIYSAANRFLSLNMIDEILVWKYWFKQNWINRHIK